MRKVFFLGAQRRCYDCRSRGDKGVCKDPFNYNVTTYLKESSIEARPCASGWCGKIIEGTSSTFKQDGEFLLIFLNWISFNFKITDYEMATQRMCLLTGPTDSEDRCAFTTYNYKKVYLCFCQGDLCNSSNRLDLSKFNIILILSLILIKIGILR